MNIVHKHPSWFAIVTLLWLVFPTRNALAFDARAVAVVLQNFTESAIVGNIPGPISIPAVPGAHAPQSRSV